jgi:PTH2 family peptidyl-tRNA hydrolase
MRRDLNMRKGKMCAQAGHAVLGAYMKSSYHKVSHWRDENQKKHGVKITVYVKSEEELLKIHQKAGEKNLVTFLVKDIGLTEFKEPTFTCLAIGPDVEWAIDEITGDLPLL